MDFRPRIARGMEWLDAERAGWLDRIDMSRLDVGCPCNCLLGQEFDLEKPRNKQIERVIHAWDFMQDGFDCGLHYAASLFNLSSQTRTVEWAVQHGFSIERELLDCLYDGDADVAYGVLTDQWREAILARQQQVAIANEALEQEQPQHQLATAG